MEIRVTARRKRKARPSLRFEKEAGCIVCGVDEVGCAPLAGPVVAAAIILPPQGLPRKLTAPLAPAMAETTVCVVLIGTPPNADAPMLTAETNSAVTACHGLQSFLAIFLILATMRQPPQRRFPSTA